MLTTPVKVSFSIAKSLERSVSGGPCSSSCFEAPLSLLMHNLAFIPYFFSSCISTGKVKPPSWDMWYHPHIFQMYFSLAVRVRLQDTQKETAAVLLCDGLVRKIRSNSRRTTIHRTNAIFCLRGTVSQIQKVEGQNFSISVFSASLHYKQKGEKARGSLDCVWTAVLGTVLFFSPAIPQRVRMQGYTTFFHYLLLKLHKKNQ